MDGPHGITALVIKAVIIASAGPAIKRNLDAALGMISSFMKSFKPSARGCNKPKGPALLGPRRSCITAATFLSAHVAYIAITIDIVTIAKMSIAFSNNIPQSIDNKNMLFFLNYFLSPNLYFYPAYNRSEERRVGKECRSRWSTKR